MTFIIVCISLASQAISLVVAGPSRPLVRTSGLTFILFLHQFLHVFSSLRALYYVSLHSFIHALASSHGQILGMKLLLEFHIFCSHTDWHLYLFFCTLNIVKNLGNSTVNYQSKLNCLSNSDNDFEYYLKYQYFIKK